MRLPRIRKLINHPTTPGILLILSGAMAMLLSNTKYASSYFASINSKHPVNLLFIVNDILMVIFFLEIGLEVKYQAVKGQLSSIRQAALPLISALGGVLTPALIYTAFNYKDPITIHGWAIPTATDIAFALGVIILLGKRIPIELRVLLLAIAVIDDLMAIIIIAFFYTKDISILFVALSFTAVISLCALNYFRVKKIFYYLIIGSALWYCMLKAGIHPTLSGVITAFTIPLSVRGNLHKHLTSWVTFGILPLFAFCNAGISLQELSFSDILEPVPLGIALGLIMGKQIGVFSFAWLSVKTNIAVKPQQISWSELYGMALLCGIGFTMSIFISNLSFANVSDKYLELSKLGVLCGSTTAAILGYIYLSCINRTTRN